MWFDYDGEVGDKPKTRCHGFPVIFWQKKDKINGIFSLKWSIFSQTGLKAFEDIFKNGLNSRSRLRN
jgi:hypothetical protein